MLLLAVNVQHQHGKTPAHILPWTGRNHGKYRTDRLAKQHGQLKLVASWSSWPTEARGQLQLMPNWSSWLMTKYSLWPNTAYDQIQLNCCSWPKSSCPTEAHGLWPNTAYDQQLMTKYSSWPTAAHGQNAQDQLQIKTKQSSGPTASQGQRNRTWGESVVGQQKRPV